MTKEEIRKSVLAKVSRIEDKEERSKLIRQKFLSLPEVKAASSVALFMSTKTEPDTSYLISTLVSLGKKVYLPVTCGEEMYFVQIEKNTAFTVGAFGIKEPVGKPYLGDFDVMAVPLVAFDKNNNRLGHGKGYYDRYLSSHPCFTVGLAFSEQKNNVPTDRWDVPLNLIISY